MKVHTLAGILLLGALLFALALGHDLSDHGRHGPGDELISEQEFRAKLMDKRCVGVYNSTCLGYFKDGSCKGDFVELRCDPEVHADAARNSDLSANASVPHEGRSCSELSYKVYYWKQIAKDASTPRNNFISYTDAACETECYQYRKSPWVVGWTRDWATSRCQCFIEPFGDGTNLVSAVRAQATTGFFRNWDTTSCEAYMVKKQRIWADVLWTGLTIGIDGCFRSCATVPTSVVTFKLDGYCYCLNTNWRSTPMTYTPDSFGERDQWWSGLKF